MIAAQLTKADLALAGREEVFRDYDPQIGDLNPVLFLSSRGSGWESPPTEVNGSTLIAQTRVPYLGVFVVTLSKKKPPRPTPTLESTPIPFLPVPTPAILTNSEVPDQSFLIADSIAGIAEKMFGQAFTDGESGLLTKIGFTIEEVHNLSTGRFETGIDATLRVYENGSINVFPIGPQVHSQHITVGGGWQWVTLSAPVSVIAGQVYTFQVETRSSVCARISSVDLYANGRALWTDRYDVPFETLLFAKNWERPGIAPVAQSAIGIS